VAVADVLPELAEAARDIGAVAVPFDVADEDAVRAGVTEAAARLRGLDTLVANAAIFLDRPLLETSGDDLRRILDVNLIGVFNCFRAAGSLFAEQGRGVMLATASQASLHGYPGLGAYCASKFAVRGMVEVLAKELGPRGVRVACVAPGVIQTAMYEQLVAGAAARTGRAEAAIVDGLGADVPLGRLGAPEDVANAFVFLASDLASWVAGTALVVDGGEG
jgi:NAD(P)-dependent dehydrogenase (short-subunit alcohol dehydrogenase family)